MKNIKLTLSSLLLLLLLNNCGLEYMSTNYHNVDFIHSPEFLEAHGGKVQVNFKGKIPPNYFAKKANMEITPVIISENGTEDELRTIILQGESNSGGDVTIFYNKGGDFSYSDEIEYSPDMLSSSLQLRATAKLDDERKVFDTRTITKGVIATSERVMNDVLFSSADHGYEDTIILSESATIYFLVNKSNIRTSEKSNQDVERLKNFIRNGYKTESFEVKSYASPEGSVQLNDRLSNQRNDNTLKYAKYLLKKLKAEGSHNDNNYTTVSVGEDWEGFYELINSSSISDREAINLIIKSNITAAKKEEALRDMAEVYDAIDKDILPYLRKAEISINSYYPTKTDEEILDIIYDQELFQRIDQYGNPVFDNNGNKIFDTFLEFRKECVKELNINEILYAATFETLDSNYHDVEILRLAMNEYPNDWRLYNNFVAMRLQDAVILRTAPFLNFASDSREYGWIITPDSCRHIYTVGEEYKVLDQYGDRVFDSVGNPVYERNLVRSEDLFCLVEFPYEHSNLDFNEMIDLLNKARELGGDQPEILTNIAIIYSWKSNSLPLDIDVDIVNDLLEDSDVSNHNLAIFKIKEGDYRSSSRYYRGQDTYNAHLVNILNQNYQDFNCPEGSSADCYYLRAILAARQDNFDLVITNLSKAIQINIKDPYYRYSASKDLEFEKYRDRKEFQEMILSID